MTIFVATGKASEVFFSRPAVVADVVGFEGMAALHVAIHFLRKRKCGNRGEIKYCPLFLVG